MVNMQVVKPLSDSLKQYYECINYACMNAAIQKKLVVSFPI